MFACVPDHECVCMLVCVCVCVCVCVRAKTEMRAVCTCVIEKTCLHAEVHDGSSEDEKERNINF